MQRPHSKHNSAQKRSRLAGGISVVGLIGVLATLLFSGSLFWMSAPKTEEQKTPAIASNDVPLAHKQIQDIQPGQWVKADNPAEEDDTEFGKDVNPAAWRLLKLKAPKLDGTLADVSLLRPDYWLTLQSAKVGGTVYISVPECGIDGNAEVLSIEDCPPISANPGPGFQIVTGTFQHQAAKILDIGVESESKPIGTTPNHPFWSVDRQAFVRADSLTVGERLQNLEGVTVVTNITPRGPPEPVYNLEVQVKHTYYVADSGVLVHNGKLCSTDFSDELKVSGDTARKRLRKSLGLNTGDPDEAHHLIPWELKDHELVKRAAKSGFNINGNGNGIGMSFFRHRGLNIFHHSKYNLAIRSRLTHELDLNPNMTNAEAASFLSSYLERLKKGIGNSSAQLR